MTESTPEVVQAVADEVVAQLAPTSEWSVQDLTPEELAGLAQIAGTEGGLGCCQDADEAGLGDDDHGLEAADGLEAS